MSNDGQMILTWGPAKLKFWPRKRICTEVQFESFLCELSRICLFSWAGSCRKTSERSHSAGSCGAKRWTAERNLIRRFIVWIKTGLIGPIVGFEYWRTRKNIRLRKTKVVHHHVKLRDNSTNHQSLNSLGFSFFFNPAPPGYFVSLSLIHIWRCRRYSLCRSRWSPYH